MDSNFFLMHKNFNTRLIYFITDTHFTLRLILDLCNTNNNISVIIKTNNEFTVFYTFTFILLFVSFIQKIFSLPLEILLSH